MIFRVILEFDSDKNETFKGMTKERIVEYVEAMQPKDDSVSLVSISPICERCKAETKEEIQSCLHNRLCTKSK